MSDTLLGLARVRRLLVAARSVESALAAAGLIAGLFVAGAMGARAGVLRAVPWAALAVWLLLLAFLAAAAWRIARRAAHAGLRATAATVERDLGLRRGALVALVDTAAGPPAGTSTALRDLAARRFAAALPPAALRTWLPVEWGRLRRRLRRLAGAAAAAAVLAGALLWAAGDAAAVLASPWRAARAAVGSRVDLILSSRRVRRGGSVTARVRASGAAEATLLVRATGEGWRARRLELDAGGRAATTLRGIEVATHVYAVVLSASSDTLTIAVAEPPFVTELALTARYPPYLERPDEPLPADAGPLALPVGTVLEVRGAASSPLARAALFSGAARVPLGTRGAAFGGSLVVRSSAAWRLELADRAGLMSGDAGGSPPVLEVVAVPDSAPVVSVPVPGADTVATLDLRQPLVIDARDDHGLISLEVVSRRISRLGVRGEPVVEVVPIGPGAGRVVETFLLDLVRRELLPGDTVRYYARAADRAPRPQVGRSREYVLRLRSLAELREAVRAGADSLAVRGAEAAGAQAELGRRTEDLAAQRDRGGALSPQLPFAQAEEARRLADRQEEVIRRTQALREDLAALARAAEEAGLTDPAWQQQLRDLDRLLQQAITPELAQRLEELRRALERLDPATTREALRRLAEVQREVRRELERSAELFERAAIEGSLITFAEQAEALRRAEERWAARAPERRDTAAAAQEQHALATDADTLSRRLAELGRTLAPRSDSASAVVAALAEDLARAGRSMDAAAERMSAGERVEASRRGEEAAGELRRVSEALRRQQQRMSAEWRAEVLRALDFALGETVALAREERDLADALSRGEGAAEGRGRQAALQQGVDQIVRRLSEAAGRHALVSPRLGAALGSARSQMERVRQALEGSVPNSSEAAARADDAVEALSAAAFAMMRDRDRVAGAQSGSGFAEAVRQMSELAALQNALTGETGGLLPLLGSGDQLMLQQLRALAARQRALANALERLGASGLPGRPEELAEEARELADEMDRGRLSRQTIERQQRLFRRMLDAGRTLRDEDTEAEPERRSETARERAPSPAAAALSPAAPRYPVPGWDALKGLTPAERQMVLDYFRRLNAPPR